MKFHMVPDALAVANSALVRGPAPSMSKNSQAQVVASEQIENLAVFPVVGVSGDRRTMFKDDQWTA